MNKKSKEVIETKPSIPLRNSHKVRQSLSQKKKKKKRKKLIIDEKFVPLPQTTGTKTLDRACRS